MKKKKNIAVVAHDNCKADLLEWVQWNHSILAEHHLTATGTTGRLVDQIMAESGNQIQMNILKSGPLGGDQQLGALISEGKIDILIFFWDPMQPQPHDVDVKALLRLAVVYNIPTACNRSSADFLISSSLLNTDYSKKQNNFDDYLQRKI